MDELSRRTRPRRSTGNAFKRNFAVLAGFAPASQIMTEDGPVPLDWLTKGDRVLTRDAGYQPILRVEQMRLSMATVRHLPELAPVRIEAGAFDRGLPAREIVMSPSQLVYVDRDPEQPGQGGVMMPAEVISPRIDPAERPKSEIVSYVAFLMDGHHLVQIEGAWVGSLFLADIAADLYPDDEFFEGVSAGAMTPVAPILRRADAEAFLASRKIARSRRRA